MPQLHIWAANIIAFASEEPLDIVLYVFGQQLPLPQSLILFLLK